MKKVGSITMARLMLRVVKQENGCWLFTGPFVGKLKYGKVNSCVGGVEKTLRAHRVMWELKHGEIPKGALVLHTCDVPNCVCPKHLFLGSYLINAQDRERKGRGLKGIPRPLGVRKKISVSNMGIPKSEAHKLALKLAREGRVLSETHKINIGLSHKGTVRSAATKLRMSVAAKLKWLRIQTTVRKFAFGDL